MNDFNSFSIQRSTRAVRPKAKMVEENKEDISDGEGGSSGSDFEAEYRKKTILKGTKNELKVNT